MSVLGSLAKVLQALVKPLSALVNNSSAVADHQISAGFPEFCDDFPTQLALLQASAGSPLDLTRIQNESLRVALEELRAISDAQRLELKKLRELFERRTTVLSPAQGFSTASYHRNATTSSSLPLQPASPVIVHLDENSQVTGTYQTEDDPTIRAFVNTSPRTPNTPRATTQVDLVLPPVAAFFEKNGPVGIFPPLLGQKSARWPDVFALIKRPALCWAVWGPTKTLDQFENVDNLWAVYTVGDPVFNSTMMQTGVKPPLQLVENYFHSDWRTSDDVSERKRLKKSWQRFREIPEWIATSANHRHVSPSVIISELNVMRTTNSTTQKSLNWLSGKVADLRKAMVTNSSAPILQEQAEGSQSLLSSTTPPDIGMDQDDDAQLATTSRLCPAIELSLPAATDLKGKKRAPAVGARRPAKKPKQ
ncbi:hypothetical protein C8J57DRAFT_1494110 [Mycena rebaudengoi]|nr:hypothetical protein C8J57DRAFT_1494110 [Mycena rebaudengoi]